MVFLIQFRNKILRHAGKKKKEFSLAEKKIHVSFTVQNWLYIFSYHKEIINYRSLPQEQSVTLHVYLKVGKGAENLFGENDLKSDPTSRFSTMTIILCKIPKEFLSFFVLIAYQTLWVV